MGTKQLPGLQAPDGSFYVTSTDGNGNLLNTKTVLTQPTNFYVNISTGNDANNGLTPSTAWQNLQRSFDVLSNQYDFGGLTHTVNVANGTYAGITFGSGWVGAGNLQYLGNVGSPSSVIIDGSAGLNSIFVSAPMPGNINFNGFQLQTSATGGVGLLVQAPAAVSFNAMVFGACQQYHIDVAQFGQVTANTSYSISGNSGTHVKVGEFALFTSLNSITVTLINAPTISHFVDALNCSTVNWANTTFATNPVLGAGVFNNIALQFYAQLNSTIVSNNLGLAAHQAFPGSAGNTQGIAQSGSSYQIGADLANTRRVADLAPTFGLLAGMRDFVLDSNATLAAGLGNVVAGGGANFVPVYTDAAGAWRIG